MDEDYRQGLVHLFYDEAEPVIGSGPVAILIARASGRSLESTSSFFGVTRERIRQVQNKALRNIPEAAFDFLVELAELTPDPVSVIRKIKRSTRLSVRQYIQEHPELAYNYQKFHSELGLEPPADGKFYGHRSLEQFYIDYHIARVGDEYHCVSCGRFKHKSEYAPSISRDNCHVLICRECNDARCRRWRDSHVEKVRAYARKRNSLPVQKVYAERWKQKKLATDPDYFKKLARTRYRRKMDAMTPEQRAQWNAKWRVRSKLSKERKKLGLAKS